VFPRGAQLVREWHAWVYDRKKHPDLMAMLRRHELELTFIVDPGVGDELQNEPLFSEVRKMVAKKSIVNGDDR
jgi:hypothetical protein